jgi:hypothetical protein
MQNNADYSNVICHLQVRVYAPLLFPYTEYGYTALHATVQDVVALLKVPRSVFYVIGGPDQIRGVHS